MKARRDRFEINVKRINIRNHSGNSFFFSKETCFDGCRNAFHRGRLQKSKREIRLGQEFPSGKGHAPSGDEVERGILADFLHDVRDSHFRSIGFTAVHRRFNLKRLTFRRGTPLTAKRASFRKTTVLMPSPSWMEDRSMRSTIPFVCSSVIAPHSSLVLAY